MTTSASGITGLHWDHFRNGKTAKSSGSDVFELISPASGEKIASVVSGTAEDVDLAVTNAHEAFIQWSQLTSYDREKIIRKATTYVRTQADRIGMLMAMEQGKPFAQSRSEILGSCDTLDYFAAEGVRIEGTVNSTEKNTFRSWVIYQPVGVCGVITPWNYPVSLLSWKLGPALATGCTMVVKPTMVTPLSPTSFCMALAEGGIPPGVINVVNGRGSIVGDALVRHPLVKKVAMTGSTETGKKIMQSAAVSLKKISLELGGQCPAIICADANIDNAAQVVAYKGFRNDGQSCSSVNRVYVHREVHDEFVAKLRSIAEGMTIGDGVEQASVDLGPMCTKQGLKTAIEHVEDALRRGAKLITGGSAPEGKAFEKGNYYRPTILDNATDDMLVMQDETFAPIVPVQVFDSIDDAVHRANNTRYGLVSYLFTTNLKTAMELSGRLEAGTVSVNCSAVNTNYAPYAGWKDSGYGLELSRKAVFEYLNTKHVKIELV
jgi:acyl-CoA reductase-like NAD-dependent aldehyde dehydrogenase